MNRVDEFYEKINLWIKKVKLTKEEEALDLMADIKKVIFSDQWQRDALQILADERFAKTARRTRLIYGKLVVGHEKSEVENISASDDEVYCHLVTDFAKREADIAGVKKDSSVVF